MKRILLFFFMVPVCCPAQDAYALRFMNWLNDYKKDSLEKLITPDFILTKKFSGDTINRGLFLTDYIASAENCHAKYIIITPLNSGDPQVLLAEDRSDYLRYLDIRPLLYSITIVTKGQTISSVAIDTFRGVAADYFPTIRKKMKMFEDWINREYPGELNRRLYEERGLLTRRLSEFAKFENTD